MSAKGLRALCSQDSAQQVGPILPHDELQDLSRRDAEADPRPLKRWPVKTSAKRLRAQVEQRGCTNESAEGGGVLLSSMPASPGRPLLEAEPHAKKRRPSKASAKQLRAQAAGSGHSSASAELVSQLSAAPDSNPSAEGQPAKPKNWPRGSREQGWNPVSARKLRSSVVDEKRFDLADPVASSLLEPLYEGSSTARAQRQALAVTMRGGASSSTQAVAKLGNYGAASQNAERDLHRLTRREAETIQPKITHIQLTIRDFSSTGQPAPKKKKKGKKARMPKTEEKTKQLRWPVWGPRELCPAVCCIFVQLECDGWIA